MRAETMSHTDSPGLKRSGVALVALVVAVAISAVHIWMNSFGNVSTRNIASGAKYRTFKMVCSHDSFDMRIS